MKKRQLSKRIREQRRERELATWEKHTKAVRDRVTGNGQRRALK